MNQQQSDLLSRIKKASKIKEADILSNTDFFKFDVVPTNIPILNIALSGSIDGGLVAGHTALAGPSKHFKTMFALEMARAYLDKYEDAVLLFYDSEGSPKSYFIKNQIDPDRVMHVPIENIERLKTDIVSQLDNFTKDDKVLIVIDSIGNIASKKEIDDALDDKQVTDMTRAKAVKSLFRMITTKLKILDIPLITINHTYETMEMYSKQQVSGGKGIIYSADNIWIIGRKQVKEGTDVSGYIFTINLEKSRFVKEKSTFEVDVSFEGGINKWSGLLPIALAGDYVIKPKNGWYLPNNPKANEPLSDTNLRAKDTNSKEFWDLIFDNTNFEKYIKKRYSLEKGEIDDDI